MTTTMIPEYGAHVPEDKDQLLVVTPYGKGLVVRTQQQQQRSSSTNFRSRSNNNVRMRQVELLDWQQPSSAGISERTHPQRPMRPATLYSCTDFPSVRPEVGSDVVCLYGRGRVMEIRSTTTTDSTHDGVVVVVVRLSSWRLTRRSTVTCFLNIDAVRVVRHKQAYEMSVVEKVERAVELKAEASVQFTQKDYGQALQIYARAVDVVKFVQHKPDSTNVVRADLVVVMITCSNNAATCCWKLQQWDEAYKHAQQALSLLDALESKKGLKIHQELQREGHHDVRVFGEWKVKSLLIIARVLAERDETEAAMNMAKKARDIVVTYTTSAIYTENAGYQLSVKQLLSNDKELLKLYARCKERRKAQLKKEKLRAQAMFAAPSKDKKRSASPEEKKSESIATEDAVTPASVSALKTSWNETPNGTQRNLLKGATVEEEEEEVAWHQDPAFLGGLGAVIGVVGTLLLLSQWTKRK